MKAKVNVWCGHGYLLDTVEVETESKTIYLGDVIKACLDNDVGNVIYANDMQEEAFDELMEDESYVYYDMSEYSIENVFFCIENLQIENGFELVG